MKHILYLASGSSGRKRLLNQAEIPFELISHTADESIVDIRQPIEVVVRQLAQLKMDHVVVPQGYEGQTVFVLTADTLTLDCNGQILGKPIDREDAIRMILNREPSLTGTAFCLQKKEFKNGLWHNLDRIVSYDAGWCTVDVADEFIDLYLSKIPYMMVSGAISVGGFGDQFVKEIRGSYSAIVGMPMFKLREALRAMNFF